MNKLKSEIYYKYELNSGETARSKVMYYKNLMADMKYQGDMAGETVKLIQDKIAGLTYGKTMTTETREQASHDIAISQTTIELANAQNDFDILKKNFLICRAVMLEYKAIADANKIVGKTDDEMYALNALNEYAQTLAKELQAEIISLGKPKVDTIKKAMVSPSIWAAMKTAGLIASDSEMIAVNQDASKIEILKIQ